MGAPAPGTQGYAEAPAPRPFLLKAPLMTLALGRWGSFPAGSGQEEPGQQAGPGEKLCWAHTSEEARWCLLLAQL